MQHKRVAELGVFVQKFRPWLTEQDVDYLIAGPQVTTLLICSVAIASCGLCFSVGATNSSLAERLWNPDVSIGACGGNYSTEILALGPIGQDEDEDVEEEVRVLADEATLDLDGTGQVTGNVVVQRGKERMEAPTITLDAPNQGMQTPQGALMINENLALSVAQSDVRVAEPSMKLTNAEFVLLKEGYRGSAGLVRAGDRDLEFENALVTRCPPNVNAWSLETGRFQVNREQEIAEAWRVKLNLGPVPIFYVPYIRFPIVAKRTSGVLLPELESNSLHGYELAVPAYFNLAPNYDLTLSPKLSVKGNHSLEAEFRHMNHWSHTTLKGAGLPSDREYQRYVARLLRTSPPPSGKSSSMRWFVDVQHETLFGQWEANATYFLVSDTDFYRDFGESLGELEYVGLSRTLNIARWGRDLDLSFVTERYDPFRDWGSSVSNIPQLAIDLDRRLGPVTAEIAFSSARMERDIGDDMESSSRNFAELSLLLPSRHPWGYGVFEVARSLVRYKVANDSSYERKGSTALIDAGLFFERGHTSAPLGMQTLEPRIVYVHRSEAGDRGNPIFDFGPTAASINSLIEPFRAIGIDRIDDLDVLSVSTTARFLAPDSMDEKFSIQAAASYSWHNTGLKSDQGTGYGVEFKTAMNNELSLVGFHLIHPDTWTTRATGSTIRYVRPQVQLVGQVRHHQPSDSRQSYLSATIALNGEWKVFGRWHYDWNYDRHIESFAGFEYTGCCVTYRMLWRKRMRFGFADWEDLRSRSGIHIEVSLKGLTSFGDNISSIVERGKGLMGLTSTAAFN